jgi:protein-serine/threonine kinase
VSEVFSGIHPGLRAAGGQCGKEMGEVRLCAPGICGSMPYIAPEVVQKAGMFYRSPFLQVILTFNQAHMILDH